MSSVDAAEPQGGGVRPHPPSPADLKTAKLLQELDATRLTHIRTSAEKWAAGLTAVTGLVSTALFIKGPEEILKIPESYRGWVAVLVGVALGALIFGTLLIYAAAYGSPVALRTVDRTLPGLDVRYELARIEAEKTAMKRLMSAVILTLSGVSLLFAAAMITWFAESASGAAEPGVCIESDGVTVALGEIQPVEGRQELTIVPCPE